jgi:SAM-dependent methyltransferase
MDDLEYTGLMAEAWDAFRGDTSDWPDRQRFLELIRERGEPVLDVGCGTGRLLLDYLALGVDIDGLEISPDMLAILRTKAAKAGLDVDGRIHLGAMEMMALPRSYRTILVPSSSFQLLFSDEQALAAMARFVTHLEPGGTLAMPFIRFPGPADETWTRETTLADGSLVRRTSRAWFDPTVGFEQTDERWDVLRDGVVVRSERKVRSPATRAWSDAAIAALYETAGFVDVEWWSEFSRDPATPTDEVVTVVGRRPPAAS